MRLKSQNCQLQVVQHILDILGQETCSRQIVQWCLCRNHIVSEYEMGYVRLSQQVSAPLGLPWYTVLLCQCHALCNRFYARDDEEVAGDLHHISLVGLLTYILLSTAHVIGVRGMSG